jgi:hypothetical protein
VYTKDAIVYGPVYNPTATQIGRIVLVALVVSYLQQRRGQEPQQHPEAPEPLAQQWPPFLHPPQPSASCTDLRWAQYRVNRESIFAMMYSPIVKPSASRKELHVIWLH